MQLQICGAAETVTGSNHLLTLDNGTKILLDCGLYQGNEDELEDFNTKWYFNPEDIDVLILSHAHIDHCGRIPKLVKDGFRGKIYCTSATRDLAAIMLMDSAQIQESDAKYESKKQGRYRAPLYTEYDAKYCLRFFQCVEYDSWFYVCKDAEAVFYDAGHILGSATVTLKINENGTSKTLGFTGDVGRYNRPILNDPTPMPPLDYLICESTYGGEKHEDTPESEEHLLQIIFDTCVAKRGKLLIPAFSIGRTQEILYRLDKLYTAGRLENIKVYVDSPLAIDATEIFLLHPECYDDEMYAYMRKDRNPFGWKNLEFVREASESKALNESEEPCIIIAASGMANAGRIRHHLLHQIGKPENTVLIVGFCAEGTLGAKLVKKPEEVKIFHEMRTVRAQIFTMSSMSAHADEGELLYFLSNQSPKKLKQILLVHGEPKRQAALQKAMLAKSYPSVVVPQLGQIIEL